MTPEQLHTLEQELKVFLKSQGLDFPSIEMKVSSAPRHREVVEISVHSFVSDELQCKPAHDILFGGAND